MPRKTINQMYKSINDDFYKHFKDFKEVYYEMTPDEAVKILRKSSRKILNDYVDNLAAAVPGSESIQDGISVFRGRKDRFKIYIGPTYGRGIIGANLAHFFEFGTAPRKRRSISKDGKVKMVSTGQIKATPFMRPAWLANKDQFVIDTEKEILIFFESKLKKRGFV